VILKSVTPPFPATMVLTPISRHPTTLPAETIRTALASPLPVASDEGPAHGSRPTTRVSIVVLTLDNLVYNTLCLTSVLANTHGLDYELIVVDNGSTDGTREYLRGLERAHAHVRIVFNDANRGFAAGNNQGLAMATGDVLVLLNNDTIVPPSWLAELLQHAEDPRVGLVGPVTNRAGNEAEITAPYHTYGELVTFARERHEQFEGTCFDLRTATMFCVAMRRDMFERVGALDERFGIGLFEDDDYSMRVRQAGHRVICADAAFVHHFGQASIGRLQQTGEYGTLFHGNRERWEQKWGVPWQPYDRRRTGEYRDLVRRIREVVREHVPSDTTAAVISRGDEELLKLDGLRTWHFPQSENGAYAGHYPADGAACIAELERLRAKGAQYLVIPATAMWWLAYYPEFGVHLERRYRTIWRQADCGALFAVSEAHTAGVT
jgi:GT2 family glycosyltransferase